jgi:hypothetical protein
MHALVEGPVGEARFVAVDDFLAGGVREGCDKQFLDDQGILVVFSGFVRLARHLPSLLFVRIVPLSSFLNSFRGSPVAGHCRAAACIQIPD